MSDTVHTLDATAWPRQRITGVILAGGRGKRMQCADKGLLEFEDKPLIEHVISALMPQVGALLISANRNLEQYRTYGFPVVTDIDDDYPGPLAGMASGMRAAETEFILVAPCDAPFLPPQLAEGLYRALARQAAGLSVVHDGTRLQPVFSLLRRTLLPALDDYLAGGGRRVHEWAAGQSAAQADFSAQPGAFMNLNTPADFNTPDTGSDRGMRAPCRTT